MEEFVLNDNGELYIRWNLTTSFTKLSFNELISELIQEYRHTGGVYDAFIQNDGKLIGSEKIVIIRNMRDVIQLAIVLKNLIHSKFIKKDISSSVISVKFLDEYSFQLIYKYTKDEIDNIKSVKFWYENYFKVQILKLTTDLKKALEDKVISEEEAIGLTKTLDGMILSSVILYDKLTHENMSN